MKVRVGVKEVWIQTVELDVPKNATDDEIKDRVNDSIEEYDGDEIRYDHTLCPDQWTIERVTNDMA